MSYIMSIQPNASLVWIGLAAPSATMFGILINWNRQTHLYCYNGIACFNCSVFLKSNYNSSHKITLGHCIFDY